VECVDGVAGRDDFLFGLDYFRGSGSAVWLCVVLELQPGVEVPVDLALALATEGLAARGRRRFQGRGCVLTTRARAQIDNFQLYCFVLGRDEEVLHVKPKIYSVAWSHAFVVFYPFNRTPPISIIAFVVSYTRFT
jgi:hypothetical protein